MSKQYSEEELQSYAEGNFTGDVEELRRFIAQNPAAGQSVELYKQLFASIGTVYQDHEPVNLPVKLTSMIEAKRQSRESRWLTLGIAAMVLAATGIVAKNFVAGIFTMPVIIAVLILGLFAWLSAKIEIAERRRIFTFPAP